MRTVVGICFGRIDFFGGLGLPIPATLGGWKRIVGKLFNRDIEGSQPPAILIELLRDYKLTRQATEVALKPLVSK